MKDSSGYFYGLIPTLSGPNQAELAVFTGS